MKSYVPRNLTCYEISWNLTSRDAEWKVLLGSTVNHLIVIFKFTTDVKPAQGPLDPKMNSLWFHYKNWATTMSGWRTYRGWIRQSIQQYQQLVVERNQLDFVHILVLAKDFLVKMSIQGRYFRMTLHTDCIITHLFSPFKMCHFAICYDHVISNFWRIAKWNIFWTWNM